MILTCIPYSEQKDLGRAYNDHMELLPNDDDWCLFLDHDAKFTTRSWYPQIQHIINKNPECGCFVAMTNRIGCEWQKYPWVSEDDHDQRYHHVIGRQIQDNDFDIVEDVSNVEKGKVLGGVLILLQKSLWKKIGGFVEGKILGVDNDLHWRLMKKKEKVYLMKGVYVYHFYRADGLGKAHLLAKK